MTDQWLVLLSDQALVDELKQLPEEVASLRHGLAEVLSRLPLLLVANQS